MMHEEVLSGLKTIPFFSDLPRDVISDLVGHAKKCSYLKRSFIVREGDETNSLYILLSGKVRVFSCDAQGKEVTLLVQTPVSYFGELALLSNEPRSASVIAMEKTSCAVISQTDFKQWLLVHPEMAFGFIHDLASTVRRLTNKVKQLALLNVYERTVQALQDMSVKQDDYYIINHMPTQQELANTVGASREMVNKIIKELSKGGYIVSEGKKLIINRKIPNSW